MTPHRILPKNPLFRLKPRVSLRLFLLAITALVVWLGLEVARSQRQQAALDALKSAIVMWDYQLPDGDFAKWDPTIERSGPKWLSGPSGQSLFSRVEGIIAPYGLSSESYARLADLPDLRILRLSGSAIDDAGLEYVGRLTKLEALDLQMTSVTDRGLGQLGELRSLEHLWLKHTRVSDEGLPSLAGLQRLRNLYLEGTEVTAEGVHKLQASLPDCQIWWGPESSPQSTPLEATPVR